MAHTRRLRSALDRVLDLRESRPTREHFLDHFTEQLCRRGLTPETIAAKRNAVRRFLERCNCEPHEVTPQMLEAFLASVKAIGRQPPRIAALRDAIASAFDEMCGLAIAAPERPSTVSPLATARDTAEDRRAERRRARHRKLVVTLGRDIGLTRDEIARLRWTEIDLENRFIVVSRPEGKIRFAINHRACRLLIGARTRTPDATGFVFPSTTTTTTTDDAHTIAADGRVDRHGHGCGHAER